MMKLRVYERIIDVGMPLKAIVASLLIALPVASTASALEDLLLEYTNQGAKPFSAERGKLFWEQSWPGQSPYTDRRCTSCHGKNVTLPGTHIRTKKIIDPMAFSVNASRFSDDKKIEKWFKRNCKWTLGRECTPQEKGDVIVFLRSQP